MSNSNIPFKKFKAGQSFEATIKRIGSLIKVEGRIQIQDGIIYLCQDKLDGASCTDKLGFKYSWSIGSRYYPGVSSVTKLKLNNRDIIKIKPPKLTEAFGWEIKRNKINRQNTEFVFGCGEVKLTTQELRNYLKVKSQISKNNAFKDYLKVKNILEEHVGKESKEVMKNINSLIKNG